MMHEDRTSKKPNLKKILSGIKGISFRVQKTTTFVNIEDQIFFNNFLKELSDFFSIIIKLVDYKFPSWLAKNSKSIQ